MSQRKKTGYKIQTGFKKPSLVVLSLLCLSCLQLMLATELPSSPAFPGYWRSYWHRREFYYATVVLSSADSNCTTRLFLSSVYS
ncbi:hypothetical protein B0H17DRAFT_1070135 [Mycena rosella]|uniref:Secreted protein n=1 Tax=Mycena rosella TaxID=1033263 RepID=A0AAD7GC08_MYCRO|nr:hypothetical protein B0H17DRAFT_1070135 [Mycena rosella]